MTDWRRSSKCDTNACILIGRDGDEVVILDSKDRSGPVLRFSRAEWAAFTAGVKAGEFDV